MPVTVGVNMLTVVHKQSGGTVSFMPDVCLTPAPPAPPVPVPYPNVAMASKADKGATSVTVDGNPILVQGSVFSQSSGDEAGSVGGVMSGVTKGAAEFILGSFNVTAEGKGVVRAFDLMLGNKGGTVNTPPMPVMQAPAPGLPQMAGSAETEHEPDSIEIRVTDGEGKALADVRYVLEKPDGTSVEGRTDSSGVIKVEETIRGIGRITFPDLKDELLHVS
jgi:hypothetical protein